MDTDGLDKRRMVQQYVERQRAYLPTYTAERLWNERRATPVEPSRCREFGFDTPVLRPRVPVSKTQLTRKASPRRSQTHGADSDGLRPSLRAPQEVGGPTMSNTRAKGNEDSSPVDAGSERAARLADRRERKRKRRAIVNPRKHEDNVLQKRGRTKKPTALALLYGFSATNVTKDRLTLKPSPSLGVFSKGRASAKKKVTITKKSSTKNEIFSESAFLNKSSEQVANDPKVDSDGSTLSSNLTPQATRIASRTKQGGRKRTETATVLKPPQASAHTTAESEVWDIELRSKLPSSVRDVSSEPRANSSAAVVLDLRGAEWSASLDVAEKHAERSDKIQARSLSVTHSLPKGCFSRSDDHTADAPSIHPSHSASQVGRRAGDIKSSELHLAMVTSRYFTEGEPVSIATLPQGSRLDEGHPNRDIQEAVLDMPRVASLLDSLISVGQPMVEFQTRYDMDADEFPSDWSPYDDCDGRTDVPVGMSGQDLYRSRWSVPGELAGDDVEFDCTPDSRDPLAGDNENDAASGVEYDLGRGPHYESWFSGEELADAEEAICYGDGGLEEGKADFLEGRALLYGMSEWPRRVELSGLVQAERDVASRLRDHWRPLRLW